MRAAVLESFGSPLVIREAILASPATYEVLVRVAAVGICHSDKHLMEGARPIPLPAVLGHEVAGVVEAVGAGVSDLRVGDHVVGALTAFCGHCSQCIAGRLALCADTEVKQPPGKARRIRMDDAHVSQVYNLSAFAEQMLVHRSALVKIRPDMPLDRAALLGCAVTTGTGAVFRTAEVRPGATVAVVGCGGIGLSTVNGAAIAGARRIIAIDRLPQKLDMARQFGATDVINASEVDDVAGAVMELTHGGVEYAFECIGLPSTARQCYDMLQPGGIATIVGVFPVGQNVTIDGTSFLLEKQLRGSMLGSSRIPEDIPRLVDLYLQGRLMLDELISRRIRLEEINDGFAAMERGDVARTMIMFD